MTALLNNCRLYHPVDMERQTLVPHLVQESLPTLPLTLPKFIKIAINRRYFIVVRLLFRHPAQQSNWDFHHPTHRRMTIRGAGLRSRPLNARLQYPRCDPKQGDKSHHKGHICSSHELVTWTFRVPQSPWARSCSNNEGPPVFVH